MTILPPYPYPTPECEAAYQCGQEFYLAVCVVPTLSMEKALSFCENALERIWFRRGYQAELTDHMEVIRHEA